MVTSFFELPWRVREGGGAALKIPLVPLGHDRGSEMGCGQKDSKTPPCNVTLQE